MNSLLSCTPTTVHWGYLDASIPDVLVISPDERLRIDTVSGGPTKLPLDRVRWPVLADHEAILGACKPRLGPHILTGPIGIRGAEPGDLLCVRIEKVILRQNWGWNEIARGDGVLPEYEDQSTVITLPIDLKHSKVDFPWGVSAVATPFFGVLAVKPQIHVGAVSSLIPGIFGGNIDIPLLASGAEVCFPVHVSGAGFSVGDGHALQGNGEIVGTAVETALTGEFQFTLQKRAALVSFPYAWLPGRLLTLAVSESLDCAAEEAVRQAVALLNRHFSITRQDAYRHCSVCGNLAISQVVNIKKGVHFEVSVEGLEPSAASAWPLFERAAARPDSTQAGPLEEHS